MVHSQTIETYGRHAWPILLSLFQAAFIPLLSNNGIAARRQSISQKATVMGIDKNNSERNGNAWIMDKYPSRNTGIGPKYE